MANHKQAASSKQQTANSKQQTLRNLDTNTSYLFFYGVCSWPTLKRSDLQQNHSTQQWLVL